MSSQTPQYALIGDIGGTNCRLALVNLSDNDAELHHLQSYSTNDFAAPSDAIAAYLRGEAGKLHVHSASLAVAGPTFCDEIKLTNSAWRFSVKNTAAKFHFKRFVISNDLEAVGHAVMATSPGDLGVIGAATAPEEFGPTTIVAPGTGLGVSFALPYSRQRVLATEGGHTGFSPEDDVELELLHLWRRQFDHVTNEHAISGPGLVRIYLGLAAMHGRAVEDIGSREIVRRAEIGGEDLCVETVNRFAMILGTVAGDAALLQGATAAVLTGSIVASLEAVLSRGGFRSRFERRGPGEGYLKACPTLIAPRSDLGLLGALARLRSSPDLG